MAKRVADNDLNHDNWDQDEESEQAGVFKKASDAELKGRVIRKGRRRNLGEEKKNAFASFGGFATSQPSTTADSFSFLKSATPASSDKGMVFGMTKSDDTKPSFSFGSSSKVSEPVKPTFSQLGSTANEKIDESAKDVSTKNSSEPAKGDLMSMFKPKTGTWSCDVCMISNGADKVKCAACETPKPGAKQPETNGVKPAFGDSGGFKLSGSTGLASSGGFSFGSSTVATSGGAGFSFGAPPKSVSSKEEAKSSDGFKFGLSQPSGSKPSGDVGGTGGGGFVFGQPKTDKSSSLFSFGSGASPKTTAPDFSTGSTTSTDKPSFSFGIKPVDSSPKVEKTGFTFGSKSEDGSSSTESTSVGKPAFGGFTFGTKSANTETETNSLPKPADGIIFGQSNVEKPQLAKPDKASTFVMDTVAESHNNNIEEEKTKTNVESSVTEKKGTEYDEQYLAHLKALNLQVTDWIKKHVDENPLIILSPIFQDYEKHITDIAKKHPPKNGAASDSNDKPVPISTIASPPKASGSIQSFSFLRSDKKQDSTSAGFTFGSTATGEKTTVSTGGFSFGSNTGTATTGSGLFSTPASNSTTTQSCSENKSNQQAEEDEDQPPKVEIKQVVEDDALYSKRCKLFYKKDDKFVDKGLGMLYLKKTDSGRTQLLVRADTNLGNILLNIILNKDIPTSRRGKKDVMIVCIPNPPVDPKATEQTPIPMLIRVKTEEEADDLKNQLDDFKIK